MVRDLMRAKGGVTRTGLGKERRPFGKPVKSEPGWHATLFISSGTAHVTRHVTYHVRGLGLDVCGLGLFGLGLRNMHWRCHIIVCGYINNAIH